MAKLYLAIFVALLPVLVECHWGNIARRLRQGNRRSMSCQLFGMKPVVGPYGKMKRCVRYCESHHSSEFSYIHGHHCKELPPGCITADCSLCKDGFYKLFDHGKVVCVDYCPDHHVEQNRKCVEIPRECKDLDCTECADGYFYWPYHVYYGTRCKRSCPPGYKKNIESNNCEQAKLKEGCADFLCYNCKKGFFKHVDEMYMNQCVRTCPDGYGAMNNRCREIPTGCVVADCSECRDGYFKYKKGMFFQKCRKNCPSGYFADTKENMCIRCDDENCVYCNDSPSICHECRVPFALLQGETENVTKCMSKCPEGFKLSYMHDWLMFICERDRESEPTTAAPTGPSTLTEPALTNEPTTEVKETTTVKPKTFPPGCKDEFCLKCIDGFFRLLIFGSGLKCVTECPPGYFNVSSDCILGVTNKPDPIPEGCKDKGCHLSCKSGFYKLYVSGHEPKCVRKCPIGYFTAPKNCIACHEPRCKYCTKSPFNCESCRDGFITFRSNINSTVQCVDRCPKGYKRIIGNGSVICEKRPKKECNIDNCEKCADHELHSLHIGCVECKAGYLLKRNIFKDECVAVCPDGYYAGEKPGTSISACLNCDVQFCQQCVKRKKCTRCHEPFVFDYKQGLCTLCKFGTYYNKATRSCKPAPKGGIKVDFLPSKKKMSLKTKKLKKNLPPLKKKTEFIIN